MNDKIEQNNKITFVIDGKEVLELKKDGFYYKDQRIDDAGKAHKLFVECMEYMSRSIKSDVS